MAKCLTCIPGVVVIINKSQSAYDRYLMEKAYPGKFVMLGPSKNCPCVAWSCLSCLLVMVARVADGPRSQQILLYIWLSKIVIVNYSYCRVAFKIEKIKIVTQNWKNGWNNN